MKVIKVIPEIFIWLAFLVVAGFGYAFSFYGYIDRHSVLSASNIMIPTVVWLLLSIVCILLFRFAHSTEWFTRFSKKESLFLESSIFLLLLVAGWVFRFVEYFNGAWPSEIDTTYFLYAEVSENSIEYLNPHPVSRMYVGLLHIVFLFFGNQYTLGVYVQFALLLIAVFLWYFALRTAFGKVTALVFTAGAMILPDSIVSSMQCNPMMLLFAVYGLVAWQLAVYAKGNFTGFVRCLQVFVLGVYAMLCFLLDISGIWVLAAYLIALAYRDQQDKKIGMKSSFLSVWEIAGVLVSAWGFRFAQSRMYGISFAEANRFHGYHGLSIPMLEFDRVKEFVFELGTQPVFLVSIVVITIYWFVRNRSVMTWIMLGELFLLSLQLFELDFYLSHQFLIAMGLPLLFGFAAEQFLKKPEVSSGNVDKEVREKAPFKEPAVTVVRFEDRPVVTVPEKVLPDTSQMAESENASLEMESDYSEESNEENAESVEEHPLIFIPKSMEIPKRVSKPKIDFAIDVEESKLHYDYHVAENADFDV